MSASRAGKAAGSELVVAMLEIALKKARQGQVRSAILVTFKPTDSSADICGEFTHVDDLHAAIKKLGEARRMLKEMAAKSGEPQAMPSA